MTKTFLLLFLLIASLLSFMFLFEFHLSSKDKRRKERNNVERTSSDASAGDDLPFDGPLLRLSSKFDNLNDKKFVIVTLITAKSYLRAAFALATSLQMVDTKIPIVALLHRSLMQDKQILKDLTLAGFDGARVVRMIKNPARKLKQLPKTWFKMDIFTKFRVFQLFDYEKVLFLDADLIVRRNIDHLFNERAAFAFVPELMYLHRCANDTHQQYLFQDMNHTWCHGHSLTPYHGEMLRYSNTGVMLLQPSQTVFDGLLSLLAVEPEYNDTCIGLGGFCQDQRLLNIYYNHHPYKRLSLTYNAFCQKLLTDDGFQGKTTHVVHYRGGKQPMKPWIDDVNSTMCSWFWQDHCGAFVDAMAEYQRRTLLQNNDFQQNVIDNWIVKRRLLSQPKVVLERHQQFDAMSAFRDEFYNGIRHLEQHWHTIMTMAENGPDSGFNRSEQIEQRYLANNAHQYIHRMKAALFDLAHVCRRLPFQYNCEPLEAITYNDSFYVDVGRDAHKVEKKLKKYGAFQSNELRRLDEPFDESTIAANRHNVSFFIQNFPLYIILDCDQANSMQWFSVIQKKAFHYLDVSRQMFNKAALMHQNASAFGGKQFKYKRRFQTLQIMNSVKNFKQILNWDWR